MPLHLLPIMLAVLAFMLWMAFQDSDESELFELSERDDGPYGIEKSVPPSTGMSAPTM
jgi:hypothetical protein